MATLEVKSFDAPDESRPFADKGRADTVTVGGVAVARVVLEPGWKWSDHIKPIAKTDSCQANHLGYVVSGRLRVVMDDGTSKEAGPGEVMAAGPGHDAWVVGNDPCVLIDFGSSVGQFAKPS